MMMFALSKINLLILVTALFVIVVYFTFGFQDVLIANTAGQEVNKVIEQAAALIGSSSLYGKVPISIPEKISTFQGQNFYFVMKIRSVELGDRNSLIFSVISREEFFNARRKNKEPRIIASVRRNFTSSIHIFHLNEEGDLCPSDSAVLNLNIGSAIIDNAVIVKEVFKGNTHTYIIPCYSAGKGSCQENAQKVACWIKDRRGTASKAFDAPEESFCENLDWGVC